MESRPIIDLNEFQGLGLIILWPTGIDYTNQVAGFGCEHPTVEGVMLPIFDGIGHPALHALRQHFRGGWHALDKRDADVITGIFRRNGLGFLSVDESNLQESREAWVYVKIAEDQERGKISRIEG